jgi:hypothetical protein
MLALARTVTSGVYVEKVWQDIRQNCLSSLCAGPVVSYGSTGYLGMRYSGLLKAKLVAALRCFRLPDVLFVSLK